MRHVPISRVSVRRLCRASVWLLALLALASCSNPETRKLMPIADNLLKQEFDAERPNQRRVGDTSEFVIGESGNCTSP